MKEGRLVVVKWQLLSLIRQVEGMIDLSAKIRARFHRKYIGGFHSWFLCTQVGSIYLQAILADLGRGRCINRKGELAPLGAFA